jgi:enediyne biosynthesis protein E4
MNNVQRIINNPANFIVHYPLYIYSKKSILYLGDRFFLARNQMTCTLKLACASLLLLGLGGLTACQNTSSTNAPLFTSLTAEQTGIGFQNTLDEGLNTNILVYEYFYNGGGVATGDFNNDGLTDVYFTANMGDNKFYLNKGNLKFQDITTESGASGRPGPWKTGVTIVDINADGRLDLYLCYSGALPPQKRQNQLFVNQGNDANGVPQFAEQAAQYGIDSPGFSNQAYFLDYDRDGDLDMFLLNHNPKNLPILNEASTAEFLKTDDYERGLRVFKQTALGNGLGHFDDVTQQVGVNGSALSYGLGLGIADFNDDGWPDFYVSNDYAVPDYLYINQKNGTFLNQIQQSIGHTSQFSMGNDVADINNDGRDDIFTLDMLPEDNHRQKLLLAPDNFAKFDLNVRSGFYYQYMRNMLQLNVGEREEGGKGREGGKDKISLIPPSSFSSPSFVLHTPLFAEIGQIAGISNTDWSWAALLADFDNDGWKDLFVTNGYRRDYTNLDFIKYMDDYVQAKGRLQREDVLDIIKKMPASNVINYIFKNQQGAAFSNQTQNWGMNAPSNSNGAAYADLDNDGDLDLVVNNINQPAFVYRNETQNLPNQHFLQLKLTGEGGNTQGIGAKVTVFSKGQTQTQMQTLARGYLSAVSPVLHFGLGETTQLDSVVVAWSSGKKETIRNLKANQVLTVLELQATQQRTDPPTIPGLFAEIQSPIAYENPHQAVNDFDRQALLVSELSHSGPCMAQGDVNQDGLEDLVIGGAAGQAAALYIQQKSSNETPRFVRQTVPAFETDKASQDAAIALFDANGDGFTDIYIASGGYHDFVPGDPFHLQDRLYMNDGKANFSKSPNALPPMKSSKSCVTVCDINADGRPDLFVGGRVVPGRYPETPASYVLINNGKGKGGLPQFSDQTTTISPELGKIGMVTDAAWLDLDQDKKPELVVVGEWMPVSVFGTEQGNLVNKTSVYFEKLQTGWWNKIAVGDFNHDKKPDLVIGNWGQNSQLKATEKEPIDLYFSDFDKNGSVEPILMCYVQGKSYPYVTRDELLQQINGYRAKYPTYESYANATLTDIFAANDLETAKHLTANTLQTTCFVSTNTGKFKTAPLPVQAQYAPVHAIAVLDANHDGHDDVLLCGNNSRAKIRLGKMDANFGVLLTGNSKGGFQYAGQQQSGLALIGDVRSVLQMKNTLFFGINERKMVAYSLKK